MAQLALTLAGAAAGNYFGGAFGAGLGAAAGAVAGGLLDNLLFGSATGTPRMGDLRVQTSTYGKPIPVPYGTSRMAGLLGWNSGLIPHKVSSDVGGGKGFGGGATTTGYTYSASFQIILCEGPIAAIGRVWADGKLLHDYRAGAYNKSKNLRGCSIALYKGTEDQMPDPTIQASRGVANTPAYRGQAHMVISHLQLADFANHIPNVTVEVMTSASGATAVNEATSTVPVGGTLLIDQERGFIYDVYAGYITKVDAATAELVRVTSGTGIGVLPAVVGADGYIYGPLGNTYNWMPLARVDPISLQVIDQVGTASTFTPPYPAVPEMTVLKSKYGFIFGMDGASGVNHQLALFTEPTGDGVFNFELVAAVGGHHAWADLDADGYLWAVRIVSGAFHLLKYNVSISSGIAAEIISQIIISTLKYAVGQLGPLAATGTSFLNLDTAGVVVTLNLVHDYDLGAAWTDTGNDAAVAVDDNSGMLLLGRGYSLVKFDPVSETVAEPEVTLAHPVGPGTDDNYSAWVRGVVDSKFVTGHFQIFDLTAWAVQENIDTGAYLPGTLLRSAVYDRDANAIWTMENLPFGAARDIYELFIDRIDPNTVLLSDIVADLCARGGLAGGQIDVTALTDEVHGFVVSRQGPVRDSIQALANAFFFDAAEVDGKLKFTRRGGNPLAALVQADLAAHEPGQAAPEPISETLLQEDELPVRVWVIHTDPAIDYQTNAQPSPRITTGTQISAKNEITLEMSTLVLTADEAQRIADKHLQIAWTARPISFSTARQWSKLTGTDVVTATVADPDTEEQRTIMMRLKQIDFGTNGILQVQAELDDPEIYVDAPAHGGGPIGFRPDPGGHISPTLLNLMDIPALRDQDALAGFYAAAGPLKNAGKWTGCAILRSTDGGASFSNFLTITDASIQGVATTVLAAPAAWATWDRDNTVTVLPVSGGAALESVSELRVLNGANVALIGDEIIQFANVTDNGDGTYMLDTLLRGRRGTDPAIGTHALGDRFILLTWAATRRVVESTGDVGIARLYKAISIGESGYPESAIGFANNGKSLMPYAVCSEALGADSHDSLLISWIRRTRIGGEWKDYVDVPLGEATEAYEVDIYDGADIVRTLRTSVQSAGYLAADQTADFGSTQTTLHIKIYQMSAVIGRGFEKDATLTVSYAVPGTISGSGGTTDGTPDGTSGLTARLY